MLKMFVYLNLWLIIVITFCLQTSEDMERSKKSGIPIPKRVAPKLEQPLSPPLSPKNEEKEENCDKVR